MMKTAAWFLIGGSLIAFAFLAYTLLNLKTLGIGIRHPRVLVEAGLGIAGLAAGLLLLVLAPWKGRPHAGLPIGQLRRRLSHARPAGGGGLVP